MFLSNKDVFMAVNLYENQKKAVKMLKPGSILQGGVGTGKSRTALAFYYEKICGGKMPRTGSSDYRKMSYPVDLYIITTAKKRDSFEWDDELALFLLSRENDVGPVNVVIDSWNNISKYITVSGAFFIFDEQRLVGTGAWVKAFWKIAKQNKWILLTATPGDNWNDYGPVFVANGFFRNITHFRNEHVIYDAFSDFPKIKGYTRTDKLEKLRKAIVVPMDSEKVATRHHEWVKVGYDADIYKYATDNLWDIYNSVPVKTKSVMCYVWRKIVNSDHRRLTAVSNILKRHPKAIIFYNFDYELENLRDLMNSIDYPYSEWNGHKHEELLNGEKWVYIVQYTAGAEGWNCTSTDTVIFYSQNYSGKVMEQAAGRIDRMNTEYRDLFYYHLFSDAPIDKSIRNATKKKQNFSESRFIRSLDLAKTFVAN